MQPLKMELTEGSETSVNHNLTPGRYPKEHIQYSRHGESLKSRTPGIMSMVPQCNRLLDEERLKANIGNAEGESKRFVTLVRSGTSLRVC